MPAPSDNCAKSLYLPGRIVLSLPQTWGPGRTRQEHHIVVGPSWFDGSRT